jgi:hypothetical protein
VVEASDCQEPGQAIDRFVDSIVFKHLQCDPKNNHAQSGGWCLSCGPNLHRAKGFWPRYSSYWGDNWGAGAADVIKLFNEIGFKGQVWVVHTVSRISCNTHPYYHQCIINNGNGGKDGISYEGWSKESIPHAICLAAMNCVYDRRSPTYRLEEAK